MLKTIGLAYRAGKVVYGAEMVLTNIRSKKVKLVVLASDASENTIKMFQDKCQFYQVTLIFMDDSKQLSQAIGKSKIKVVGILDEGFKKLML